MPAWPRHRLRAQPRPQAQAGQRTQCTQGNRRNPSRPTLKLLMLQSHNDIGGQTGRHVQARNTALSPLFRLFLHIAIRLMAAGTVHNYDDVGAKLPPATVLTKPRLAPGVPAAWRDRDSNAGVPLSRARAAGV